MIPDFKTYIKETIWSDIQDRSSGDTVRKEDEDKVNTLSPSEMYDYLQSIYDYTMLYPKYDEKIACGGNFDWYSIDVPLYRYEGRSYDCSLRANYILNKKTYTLKKIEIEVYFNWRISDKNKLKNNKIRNELEKRYITTKDSNYLYIRPKRGKVTNIFIIEVIDFILHISRNEFIPIIRKKK